MRVVLNYGPLISYECGSQTKLIGDFLHVVV
jgi:hypothetical protein